MNKKMKRLFSFSLSTTNEINKKMINKATIILSLSLGLFIKFGGGGGGGGNFFILVY
jgi:hypothetical protein